MMDTLPAILRPLMDGPSIERDCCAVCGASGPLNRHHIVRRGAGKLFDENGRERPKPLVTLCGSGVQGCHGLAHQNRLHFRYVGRWQYILLDVPTKYQTALTMKGWQDLWRT